VIKASETLVCFWIITIMSAVSLRIKFPLVFTVSIASANTDFNSPCIRTYVIQP
jgi:hypothetical protein